MGILIDSSVLVAYERRGRGLEALREQEAAISAITASEMLHGVHRARTEAQRRPRAEFVELLLAALPILPLDLQVARVHAQIWANLAGRGQKIGAHDLLIAATAMAHRHSLATLNRDEFSRIEGLSLVTL